MLLDSILRSVAEKLLIDFRYVSSQVQHRPSKGQIRETEVVEGFLRQYMPRSVGIDRGEIVSSEGGRSGECDVVMYGRDSCPTLIDKSGYKVFPIECVFAVVEVKSLLDRAQLADAFRKISAIKAMPKKAYQSQVGDVVTSSTLYDREWNYFPSVGCVFAYDSIDLLALRAALAELSEGVEPEGRIDDVYVLQKGVITNWCDASGDIWSTPGKATRLRAIKSDNPLLLMTIQLQHLMLSAWSPPLRIKEYLNDSVFGEFLDA